MQFFLYKAKIGESSFQSYLLNRIHAHCSLEVCKWSPGIGWLDCCSRHCSGNLGFHSVLQCSVHTQRYGHPLANQSHQMPGSGKRIQKLVIQCRCIIFRTLLPPKGKPTYLQILCFRENLQKK